MFRKLLLKKVSLATTSLLLISSLSLPTLANNYSQDVNSSEITSQQTTSQTDSSETITVGGKVVNVDTFTIDEVYKDVKKIIDNDTINRLKALNIEYYTENGNIKMKDPSPENIAKYNAAYNTTKLTRATSYPTAWNPMPTYSVTVSKKFQKATKQAFSAAMATWLKDKTSSWQSLATNAAIAFGTYYFLNSDVEDVYTYITYRYRALSAGSWDQIGNFIGDYEIEKTERTTKSTTNTGGQVLVTKKKSSIIDPFF